MITVEFKGKVAWVTGASRGIGRAIAVKLAEAGADLVLCAKTLSALDEVQEEIIQLTGEKPCCFAYDVGDAIQAQQVGQEIFKRFKQLDILVNNAGILQDALIGMITDEQITATLNTNLAAVIQHMQIAARLMKRKQAGAIINLTSIIGRFGNVGQIVYGASKAGVIGATLSAAKELAPFNIRVNAVAPGFIDTDMARSIPEESFAERLASIKMRRIGTPVEVANAILFLASELSSYVTGQIVGVDGGMLI